tara:strand:+ start:425 stop:670 length:246 start_codon:yes stop_codon:yes gene_type:complete
MNKFFLTLIIFVFAFVFSSCKKCKDCTCSQVISQTGMADMNQTVQMDNVCDEDLDEVEGTTTITQNVAGINQTITQTCECN